MNILEQNNINNKEKQKTKKMIKVLSIILIILFLSTLVIIFYMEYLKNEELKVYIDNKKIQLTSDMFITDENGKLLVSLEDFAKNINYTVNKGEYKDRYSEDINKCHLKNQYEAVSYLEGSNEIYKTIITDNKQSEVEYEYYGIDEKVILKDNKLYTTLEGLSKGCNISYNYNKKNNLIKIYTLDYLCELYSEKIPEANELIENDTLNSYKNRKALLYNMIVVKSKDEKLGVNNLDNLSIIGEKYKNIVFLENSQEFLVETENGKIGIIDKDGSTKIKPEYSSIKLIDKEKGLYLVSKDILGKIKYGIIDGENKNLIHLEYDQIGIDKLQFKNDKIKNQYILFDKCIPVKLQEKWGLININEEIILPLIFDDFGCKEEEIKNRDGNSLLLIPEYEAIVVKKDKLFGLVDSNGKELIPPYVTDMYTIKEFGEKKYCLTYNKETMNILEYLKDTLKINPVVKK